MNNILSRIPGWNPQPQQQSVIPSINSGGIWGRILGNTNKVVEEEEEEEPIYNTWLSRILGRGTNTNLNTNNSSMEINLNPPQQGTTLSNLFGSTHTGSYSGYDDAFFDGIDDDNWWNYYNY